MMYLAAALAGHVFPELPDLPAAVPGASDLVGYQEPEVVVHDLAHPVTAPNLTTTHATRR